jgi:branched-subunit amino acid ABC-type transport system permease component/ABC-type branched-subunit amino acid transport system substrate-binding protein
VILLALALPSCERARTGALPIVVGLQAPLTGDYAFEGQMTRQSVEVAKELLDEKGGVLGRPIEILVADDASNPRDSALAAQKLVSQGALAVIGTYGSSVTMPAADIYEKNRIACVGYGCTAVGLTLDKPRRFFLRTCGRDDAQGEFFSKWALEELGAKRIAIMHDNSTFARGVAEEARKAAEPYLAKAKAQIVYYDAITAKTDDYSASLTKLRETHPDVWYYTGYYAEAGLLIRQGRNAGITCPFVGGNAAINEDFVKIAGPEAATGALMTQEPLLADVETPLAKEFRTRYRSKFGELPSSPWPIYAADALFAIAGAIGKAGSADPQAIAQTLHSRMVGVAGVTGPIRFTDSGDRVGVPYLMYEVTRAGKLSVFTGALRAPAPEAKEARKGTLGILVEQAVNGLTVGSFYALMALGYCMVYGVLRLINFAHGDLFALGAYVGYAVLVWGTEAVTVTLGVWGGVVVASLVAFAAIGIAGVVMERVAYRPVYPAGRLSLVVSALGMSIFLQNAIRAIWGARPHAYPSSAVPSARINVLGLPLTSLQVWILVLSFSLMVAMYLLIEKTSFGAAIRATALDREAATLMGIDTRKVILFVFALGPALGGMTGVMNGMYYRSISAQMGWTYGMKAFTATIIGGIGNIPGAMLGGLFLGLLETFFAGYVSDAWKDVLIFAVLILVLVFRPTGILAEKTAERV